MHARQATPEDAADMARIYNQGIADRLALESLIAWRDVAIVEKLI
jgi:hypothetical protein